MQDLTIIIPTLNEEKNIKQFVTKLKELYPEVNLLVVDDDSKDKTRELAKPYAEIIHRTSNKGLTASIMDGILQTKTPYFIVTDADFQHPQDKIQDIYDSLSKCVWSKYPALCIAVRKTEKGWSLKRKIISKIAILLGNIRLMLVGKYYKDNVSGFFGGRTYFISHVYLNTQWKFQSSGYKALFDILKYIPKTAKVSYVYYDFNTRKEGESKLGKKQIISFIKSLLN